ncbi:MAG: type II secretion system F family protein [Lentisphaeria bacterium]|nr:type II secretion system F family protein [Lentisphaeria bacterium]
MGRSFDSPEVDLPPVQSRGEEKRIFEYLAMDENGRELRGQIRATDEIEAVAKLRKQQLFPIEVWRSAKDAPDALAREKAGKAAPKPKPDMRRLRKAVSTRESRGDTFLARLGIGLFMRPHMLALFTRQMATMLDAGLPLLLSLRTLHEQAGRRRRYRAVKVISADMARKVEAGMSFSEALEFHPRSFNRLYTGLVRAGEASGTMEEVLNRLAEYIEKTERLKKKIRAGMTYPVVVLLIAMAITLGLMIGVVPKFAEMFDQILEGIPLPFLTQMVIGCSNVLMHNIVGLVIVVLVAIIGLRVFMATRVGRNLFDWYIISMPPLGGLVSKISVARFCSTLGTLLDSGVPILDALQIVRDAANNEVVVRTVNRVHQAVMAGEKLATPLDTAPLFPSMVVRMIEVGEQTGALPDMLKRIGRTFEEEVEMTLEALISLIEPVMICFLAVIIGTIVLALFLPLIKIIETLGV